MNNQIENAIKAGRGYWFVDGYIEILGGLLFILLGALLAGAGPVGLVSLAGQIVLVKVAGLLAGGLLVWWLKDRFTYPRTGYVRGKRPNLTKALPFLRNAALGLLLPLLLLAGALTFVPALGGLLTSLPVWSPVLIALLWGGMCFLAGRWLGLRRFELLAALILLTGLLVGALQLAAGLPAGSLAQSLGRALLGLGVLTIASGKFFLISGLVILLRYRHANPLPYQEAA